MSEEEGEWSSSVKAVLASVPFSYESETLPSCSIVISLLSQKDLLQVIKVLTENEANILTHEEDYELFYSSYAALSTYHLCAGVGSLQKASMNDLEKACKVLLKFFLNRLQKKYENCPIAKKQLIILIKSLCRGVSLLPKSDITVFITQLKFAKVPQKACSDAAGSGAAAQVGSPQKPLKVAGLEKSTAYEQMLSIFCDVATSIQSLASSATPATNISLQTPRSKGKKSHLDTSAQQSVGASATEGMLNSVLTNTMSASTPQTLTGSRKGISEGEAALEMQEIMAARNLVTLQRHLKGNDILLEVCTYLQSLKKFESGGFCGNISGKDPAWPTGVGEALPVVARLQQVAADVSIVWRIFSLPIYEPLTKNRLKTVVCMAMSCLNAAISVTLATSIISVSTSTPVKGASMVKDEEMDGYAASVVQKSLDIFNWVSQALQKSSKAGGPILQNYHLMGAWSLLKGLQSLLFLNLTISTEKVKEGAHKTGKSQGDPSGVIPSRTKDSKDTKDQKDKESKEGKESKDGALQSSQLKPPVSSKMQITFGPLYVALANQALRLLVGLIKDLELETLSSATEVEQEEIGEDVKLFEEYTALQRTRKLTKAICLSNLFHFLISQFFRKGLTCSKSSQQKSDRIPSASTTTTAAAVTNLDVPVTATSGEDKVEGADQEHGSVDAESTSSDSNTFYEEDFSSSQEDISYEEEDSEPILGQWFEETLSLQDALSDSHDHSYTPNPEDGIASSIKSSKHPRRHSNTESTVLVPDRKEPEAYVKLATDILNFTIQHFVESSCTELVQYFSSRLTEDHVNQLANLVKELDAEFGPSPPSPIFEGFSKSLACFVHLLINKGLLSDSLQMIFLEQLGLNVSSKLSSSPSPTGDSWPLQVQPRALSILAEVFLKKQQGDLGTNAMTGDTSNGTLTFGTPKKALSWSALVLNAWHKFIRSLTLAITSQPSGCGEFVETEDVNAEHIQLLLFLFHNLTLMEKKALWIHLCSCIIKVHNSIKDRMTKLNPLLIGRLILIADYMLHCFYEAPPTLSEKVASGLFRVFTGTLKDSNNSPLGEKTMAEEDDSSDERYYYESDMERASKVNGEESSPSALNGHKKNSVCLFQMKPKFYKLRHGECSSVDPPKVDGLACSFLLGKNETFDYNEFYDCILSLLLCGSQTKHSGNSDIKDVLKWATCRKYHLLTTWRLLSSLPPSVSYLRSLDTETSEFSSELAYLHASRWIPKMNHHSHQVWTKDFLVKQGLTMQAAESLMSDVIKKAGRFSATVSSVSKIICAESFLESLSQPDVFQLCLVNLAATGLYAFLDPDLQVKTKLWIELPETIEQEDLDKLLDVILLLLKTIFKVSREFLMKMTRDEMKSVSPVADAPNLNSFEEMQLVGFTKNSIITEHFSSAIPSLYPPAVKMAVDKWNEAMPSIFPTEFLWKNGGDTVESHLDKLQRAHLSLLTGYTTVANASELLRPSLKNTFFTLTTLFIGLLEKLPQPDNKEKLSQFTVELSCHAVSGFMPDLIRQLTEKMKNLCEGSSHSKDKWKRATTAYLVEVCHKVIFLHDRGGLAPSEEKRTVDCLGCLESVVDKPLGRKVLEEYYHSNPDDLFQLLMMISRVAPSCGYQAKILKYVNKLLQIATGSSDGIRSVVSSAIKQMSDCTTMQLTEWMAPIIVPAPDLSTGSTESQFVNLKSLLWSFIASIRDAKLMEELGPILLCVMGGISHDLFPPKGDSSLFPEMFNVMVGVASVLEAPHGPQTLFTSAASWINFFIKSLADQSTNGLLENEPTNKQQQQCIMESMCCIFQYMRDICISRQQSEGGCSSPLPIDVGGTNYLFHPTALEYESDANEDNAEEDDSNDDESDEESLANKLCTYTITQKEFMNQHWYHCHTCKMVDGVGVCTVCAKVCHKDHDISYSKYGSFFCDCGAREDDTKCLALKKRTVTKDHKARQQQKQQRKQRSEAKQEETTSSSAKQFFSPLFWSEDLLQTPPPELKQTPKGTEDEDSKKQMQEVYFKILSEKKTIDNLVGFFDQIHPVITSFYAKLSPGGFLAKSQKAINELHQLPKSIEMSDSLMVSTLGAQEGTLESIKMNFAGDQGQTIRQLITSHVLRRAGATCLASPFSRRQFLAVSCEKGKVIVLQMSTLLKQVGVTPTPSGKKKVVISKHAAAQVPFTVLNIIGCPSNEDLLAVCGLKDCHILTFTSSGSLSDHLVLHLALESGNFIIKAVWLPGSQSEIAVVTADFVKIYNLSQDVISPQYFFHLPTGKIRDATFVCSDLRDARHIIIMSSTGYIYTQELDSTSSARTGIFYITSVISVVHPELNESNGHIAGGGASVYYSHGLQMLFFSYTQGKNFAAPLGKDLETLKTLFQITVKSSNGSGSGSNNNSKTSPAGQQTLVQWVEVFDHPGLVCCSIQSTINPIVLFIKPDKIHVQEIKFPPSKNKLQDMVLVRHFSAPASSNSVGTPASGASTPSTTRSNSLEKRTSLVLIFDDGSLKILTADPRATDYWMMTHSVCPEVIPAQAQTGQTAPSSKALLPPKTKKKSVGSQSAGRSTGQVTFLIDFFEHCQVLNEVEFGGNDMLQFYHTTQLKNRLNTTGMYVACNKPGGFTIEVTNPTPNNVMVGIRVLVGSQSLDRAPSSIEIFGRVIQINLTRNRWYDVPFTREESLGADKNFTITFGQSRDPNHITMVDSVKVYVKSKSTFGWPYDAEELESGGKAPPLGRNFPGNDGDLSSPMVNSPSMMSSSWAMPSPLDRLLVKSMELLEDCFSNCRTFSEHKQLKKLAQNVATNILVLPVSGIVQHKTRSLLSSLFTSKAAFYWHIDQVYLSMMIKCIESFEETSALQFDTFQKLIPVVANLANTRPSNFGRFYNSWKQQQQTLSQDSNPPQQMSETKEYLNLTPNESRHLASRLSSAFWHLVSMQVDNPITLPVFASGVSNVSSTVSSLVVILHSFLLLDGPEVMPLIAKLLVRMLLSENQQVNYPCKHALIKIYKPPVPARSTKVLPSSNPAQQTASSVAMESDSGQKTTDATDRAITQSSAPGEQQDVQDNEQQQQASAGSRSSAPDVLESDLGESGNIQAYLDADDETMVQLAIALSLQDQPGSSADVAGDIQALGAQLQAAASHLSDVTASNQASDDEVGSTAATEGSALQISPAEPRVSAAASESSGSNAGSVSVSGRSSATAEIAAGEATSSSGQLEVGQGTPGGSATLSSMAEDEEGRREGESDNDGEAKWHLHYMKMLKLLVGYLPELRNTSGNGAVPFLQFLIVLAFEVDPVVDSATLEFFLTHVIEELDVSLPDRDTDSPSVLLARSPRWEVRLLLLRMLSVFMSRSGSRITSSSTTHGTTNNSTTGRSSSMASLGSENPGLSTVVAHHLKKKKVLEFCLRHLQLLLSSNFLNSIPSSQSKDALQEHGPKIGQLLKPRQLTPPPDLSPFFLKQYTKSHATDVFEDFHQLLVEILLRIPYQVKKLCDSLKFSTDWHFVLAEYMITNQVPFVKKQVRKLLLYVCGSKERYRLERDLHFLEKHMGTIREICTSRDASAVPYDLLITVIDHLKSCLEVATTRTLNWQKFCQKSKGLLPFLIQSSVTLDEGVAPLLLQLLQYVLCGDIKSNPEVQTSSTPSKAGKSSSGKKEKEKRLSENSDNESVLQQHDEGLCTLLTQQICSTISNDLLTRFIICFLLESNQTSVRWQAHSLVLNIFRNSLPDQKESIIDLMWNIWPDLHIYGSKAAQFVDLLGYFTIKATHISESKLKSYVERALTLMRTENKILANHPNGTIYNTLEGLVDFDGYYLERDPCLVCNNPEVPFGNMKLSAVKSDSKFTTSCQIVKLNASHTISRFVLRITEIKRSKMVKTLVVYYNNKQVQAILELKNKPALWHKAKKVTLNPGQSEVKVEFSLPIVACNLMIEFADFYDNVQASAETLQCPRCSASVPANPGVCNNCGENVFQCHKCRAINYDEKDPFLCNSCGFCKYAKFDFTMMARQCCAVDPIENEEDRKKAVISINSLLESADGLYKMLQGLKATLDVLLVKVTDHHTSSFLGFFDPKEDTSVPSATPAAATTTPAGPGSVTSSAPTGITSSLGSINKSLQQLALKYCGECKNSFDELSKIIQKVLATRKELVEYDRQQQEIAMLTSSSTTLTSSVTSTLEVNQLTGTGPSLSSSALVSSSLSTMRQSQVFKAKEKKVHCYGCSSSSVEHCITLLRAMSTNNVLKDYLCGQGLIQELFDYNLRRGSAAMRSEVRQLLCLMSTNHVQATDELLKLLHNNVDTAMKGHFANPDFASAVRHEMCLLGGLLQIEDNLWEQRLRCVMGLFMASVKYDSPSVQDCISLPCLRIFQRLIKPIVTPTPLTSSIKNKKDKTSSEALQVLQPPVNLTANLKGWLKGDPSASFNAWKASLPVKFTTLEGTSGSSKKRKEDKSGSTKEGERSMVRVKMLSEKYFNRWLYNTKMGGKKSTSLKMIDRTWMKKAMFSPASVAMRQTECQIVESICKVPGRKQDVIDMLSSCLEEVGTSGEASAEYLALYKKLISGAHWKYYVALKGVLFKITSLITREISDLQRLESISLTSDLSQGFALKSLTDLLSTFLEVDSIKQHYKNRLVGSILDGYLSLKKLVVQRTKMIDETQEKLLELLEEMTTGNESETKEFMVVCVDTVNKYPLNDFISPVFIFERLCNIIYPEASGSREFLMSLEKEPQQEDFLQGRMMGNPYSSNEPGLGPLMRDVKNKICQDCELVALLEDDTGMELLVNNKIISLDLPVKDVYRKIWLPEHTENDAMRIVYRMRGLLGDATEDMVNSLETGKDSDVDCEDVYKMANVMSQCNGLRVMLQRLSGIHNLVTGKQLMVVLLKLFSYCLKVKSNKQELIKIEMNAITVMLGALNLALLAEQETGTSTKGQTLTEEILQIMEIILLEASSHQPPEIYKEFSKSCGDKDQLMVLLDRINSPFVRCNSNVLHSLMRLIPFLAYADEEKMAALCNHFKPYLDFNRYDFDHTQDEQVHLDCFCIIAQGIENNANGRKLKDLILERTDIVKDTTTYILNHTPSSTGPPILTENEGWKDMISKPALPFALRLLTGLCKGHDPIKLQLLDIIPTLHNLEQISSDERVGSLAENLLEALKENERVAKKIEDVRQQTKMEKKRLAMAMREKQLDQLGMMTNEKGQVTAKRGLLKGQIDVLKEETGLTCCICREGYKNQPNKVLGIYTFTKRVNLDEFENKQRKTFGYSTVTHFNIVHFDCHLAAVRHARAREEWESAALQNGNTKCNGLLPLWGPEVLESAFASCLAKHNGYLQEVTGMRDSNYLHSVHDLKHLLLRFAFERSFSEDSGGGGRGSNMHLVPYMLHLNLYVVNTTRSALREEGNIGNFLKFSPPKFLENCYETEGPLFYTVLAFHIMNPQSWKTNRENFLKRLLVMGHVRHVSPSPCNSVADKTMKEYAVYKPYLMFYQLISMFYSDLFKGCKQEEGPGKWSASMADFIRHNDQSLLEASKRVLKNFEEECLPCECLIEFFDVAGLLESISDPFAWLQDSLNSLLP